MHVSHYRSVYKRAAYITGPTAFVLLAVPFFMAGPTDFFLNHPALLDTLPPLFIQSAIIVCALFVPAACIGWMGQNHKKTSQKITQCAHGLSVTTGLTLVFHLLLGGMTKSDPFWHSLLAHSLHPTTHNNITAIACLTLGAFTAVGYVAGFLKDCWEQAKQS